MKHQQLKTSPEISKRMSHVKTKRNSAEVMIAKSLWHRGYRYRLNYKALPGSPDIALTKYRIAIFIDGEFWHGKDFEQRKENLIKKGKELGFITYEELAEELKGLEIGSDLLDELYNALMENDISVVSESDLDDGSDEDDGGDLEDILKDNNIAKELTINDPVRMYLKEIGKIITCRRD